MMKKNKTLNQIPLRLIIIPGILTIAEENSEGTFYSY